VIVGEGVFGKEANEHVAVLMEMIDERWPTTANYPNQSWFYW
jgi:hypothetical protein